MNSENTKEMKKLFEGWRKHNSAGLTEAEDPDSIPLAKGTGTRGRATSRKPDPDAIPLGGSGAVSGDLSPDARKQAEKALKAAGIDTPLDRLRYFGEISGNNVAIEIPTETRVLDPKKQTYRLWVSTTEGLACIELKGGRATFILPQDIKGFDIGPSGQLWNPGKLSGYLDELKEEWFDKNDPANRRLIRSLDNAHAAAMDALRFADRAEFLAASGELGKGKFASLWARLTNSYKSVRNYFSFEGRDKRHDARLGRLRMALEAEFTDYSEKGRWNLIGKDEGGPGGPEDYNPRIRDRVEVDLAQKDRFLKFNEEARQTWIKNETMKVERLKDELNRLEGANGLLTGKHRWYSLRPIQDQGLPGFDDGVSLQALATPEEDGECDRYCQKAKKKLAELQQEAKFLNEEIDLRNELLDKVRELQLKPTTTGRKAWEAVKRTWNFFSDKFIRVFKWMARKLAFLGHPFLVAAGVIALAAGVMIVYNRWRKYSSRMNEVIGKGADKILLFLAFLVEEDPTGFLDEMITGFFLETAFEATRKPAAERNVLEQAVAGSLQDYYYEQLYRADSESPEYEAPPDEPVLGPGGDLLENSLHGRSLKIILG